MRSQMFSQVPALFEGTPTQVACERSFALKLFIVVSSTFIFVNSRQYSNPNERGCAG